MAKNRNKINPFKDKILTMDIIFEFNNVKALRWDVSILYKGGVLRGSIYNPIYINQLGSNDSLKRSKGYWAVMNSIVNQNAKNQLKLWL